MDTGPLLALIALMVMYPAAILFLAMLLEAITARW